MSFKNSVVSRVCDTYSTNCITVLLVVLVCSLVLLFWLLLVFICLLVAPVCPLVCLPTQRTPSTFSRSLTDLNNPQILKSTNLVLETKNNICIS